MVACKRGEGRAGAAAGADLLAGKRRAWRRGLRLGNGYGGVLCPSTMAGVLEVAQCAGQEVDKGSFAYLGVTGWLWVFAPQGAIFSSRSDLDQIKT